MKNQLLFKASLIFSFYLSLFIFPIGNVFASTIEFTTPPTPLDSTTLISNPEVKISTTDSSQHYVFTNVNNSLVGWWKGEGNINDESSFSNNGTLNGGATYVTGKFGQAFNFNGIDQDVSTSTSVLPQGTKAFTISLWIKPASLGYWKGIIGKGSADNNVITIQAHVDGSIYGDVDNGSGDSYGQTSPGILSVGNWSHVVMVYNGDGSTNRDKLKLYINSTLVPFTFAGNIPSTTGSNQPFYIGQLGYSNNYFDGAVDDVLVFNRNLSINEVKSLYNANSYPYDETLVDLALGSNTIKAHNTSLDGVSSSTEQRTYNVEIPPATPIASPGTGKYNLWPQSVSLSSIRFSNIVYSLSSIPIGEHCSGDTATLYSVPISVSANDILHVRACNAYGDTDTSFIYSQMVAPGAPTNVSRVSGSYSNFVLGWTAPSNDSGTISAYRFNYIDNTTPSDSYEGGLGNVLSYQFSSGTFIPGHTYEFYINAYNDVGGGSESEHFIYTFPAAASYTISSCQDLQDIQNDLWSNYTLSGNLDCSQTSTWNSNGNGGYQGFLPIGVSGDGFKGTFNGNNNTISGLYINRPNTNLIGLFGVIEDGASVSNLGLENVNITGYDDVGALVGGLSGTVTNVYSTGQVNGNISVGGLAGIHATSNNFSNSSPLVYTWNGEKYKYVADVGQMMLRSNNGLDLAQIDSQDLVPKDNKYSMKISEEYNEIVYYDELALMTFDHVPGYTVVSPLNRDTKLEDLRTISDTPTNPLIACTDKYGNNCLDSLKNYDDKWSYKDNSFVNSWVLDFGNLANKNNIQLIIRGARDFAASASGNYEKIRNIEVKDSGGKWVTIYDKNSLASDGTPRLRTIDLTGKFLSDNYQVRVTMATQNINYFAIDTSPQVPFTTHTYYPTKADLQFQGFTAIDKTYYYNHDYSKISSTPDGLFVKQTGNFTKYGDVSPLLQSKNDQFVVMHYGDAMNIEFPYVAPSAGLERSFILYNDVLYKHASNDKIGSVGKTVSPLPFSGMTKYPYSSGEEYPLTKENQEYLNNWNTRVITGIDVTHGSTVIDSYSTATINGSQNVGGLVGFNNKEIRTSYATGNVNGDRVSGGLVGYNNSSGLIHNSYATGNVTVTSQNVGGLVGLNYGTITNTYATGGVNTGTDMYNYAGGLIGVDNSSGVSNSFSTGDVSLLEGNLFSAGFAASDYSSNYDEVNNYWFNNLSNGLNLVNSTGHPPINAPSKDYFKGLDISTKAPFVGQWEFINDPVWYTRSNDYPKLTREVIIDPTCSDGILNQNEIGIDTGGICTPVRHSSSGSYLPGYGPRAIQPVVVAAVTPTPSIGIKGLCSPSQILTQNLKAGVRNGFYSKFAKIKVTEVKILQAHMNRLGFASGKEDGILGPITDGAIKRMQKFLGTYQDGLVGPLTRELINNSCGEKI